MQRIANDLHGQLLALSSCIHDGMVHDEGWCFIELGRRIKRTIVSCRILDAFGEEQDPQNLMLALRIGDCDITWRVRFGQQAHAEGLKLLLQSTDHP